MPITRLLIEHRPGLESVAVGAGELAGWEVASLSVPSSEHPWDTAHRAVRGLESTDGRYAEPDFVQSFPYPTPEHGLEAARANPCEDTGPNTFWPVAPNGHGWHLDPGHSQLAEALAAVGKPAGQRIRIAHLDTGYDPEHSTLPPHVNFALQRSVARGEESNDATDPERHRPWNQIGHGTATLALLASGDPRIGGVPIAEVVPIRIAGSVMQFHTSSIAAGIEYAASIGCRVLSMSMGGMPARSWATAVNRAYEAGVAMFTAAGNRFGKSPPWSIVWPARFERVVAVCGVTADGTPYYKSDLLHTQMQGCFGPAAKMATALAAYSPNCPWALIGCRDGVGYGGGTSSATPQVAAAAALWLARNPLPSGLAPWQAVEAVRNALFVSSDRSFAQYETYYGQGVLKARAALEVPFRSDLQQSPEAVVSFPWLRMLNPLEAVGGSRGEEEMYEVEALQVYLRTPKAAKMAGGADPIHDPDIPSSDRKKVLATLRDAPGVSHSLREKLSDVVLDR